MLHAPLFGFLGGSSDFFVVCVCVCTLPHFYGPFHQRSILIRLQWCPPLAVFSMQSSLIQINLMNERWMVLSSFRLFTSNPPKKKEEIAESWMLRLQNINVFASLSVCFSHEFFCLLYGSFKTFTNFYGGWAGHLNTNRCADLFKKKSALCSYTHTTPFFSILQRQPKYALKVNRSIPAARGPKTRARNFHKKKIVYGTYVDGEIGPGENLEPDRTFR